MPVDMSAGALVEKQKLHGDGAFLVLLEISFPSIDETVYLVRNTEDILWGGKTWTAFPFELEDFKEDSSGGVPELTLKVSNVQMNFAYYVDQVKGGVGATFILRVVHSNHLDVLTPELEEEFFCQSTKVADDWITFSLGAGESVMRRFPQRRYIKNFCPYKYKGIECGAMSGYEQCDRTLVACRIRGNNKRFGGFVSIGQGGVYL